jgi:protein-L-isoaspartate(D-aspartate) O-methyltransferase
VFSIELLPALATLARETLRQLAIGNVEVVLKDGTLGHEQAAPYDAIVVAAGAPSVPKALLDQLADNGVMLIPVGNHELQQLLCIQKHDGSITSRAIMPCSFVPLLGQQGWAAPGNS